MLRNATWVVLYAAAAIGVSACGAADPVPVLISETAPRDTGDATVG